jgi:hypothetical protein
MAAFDLVPSPRLGAILQDLLVRAIADPTINTRDRLLAIARPLARADEPDRRPGDDEPTDGGTLP